MFHPSICLQPATTVNCLSVPPSAASVQRAFYGVCVFVEKENGRKHFLETSWATPQQKEIEISWRCTMSFDWNLSSDEEEGFDGWAKVNLQESLTDKKPSAKKTTGFGNDGDESSNDDDSSSIEDNNDEDRKLGVATVPFFSTGFGIENDDEEADDNEDEDIDWEDATSVKEGDEEEIASTREGLTSTTKLASDSHTTVGATLKPVTVDWNQKPSAKGEGKNEKRMPKTRRKYRFDRLPVEMKQLLSNLERTHLLSLTSHSLYISKSCSEDELLLHMAHSMVPEHLYTVPMPNSSNNGRGAAVVSTSSTSISVPGTDTVNQFCMWYFNLVNKTQDRLRRTMRANHAAGAPRRRERSRGGKKTAPAANVPLQNTVPVADTTKRCRDYCTYLAGTIDDNPQLLQETADIQYQWLPDDKVHLFVAMARSFGWRVRYVMALEPLKRDLDVNHPLLAVNTTRNVFMMAWKQIQAQKGGESTNKGDHNKDEDDDDGGGKLSAKRRRLSKGKKRKRSSAPLVVPPVADSVSSQRKVAWVEILCQTTPTTSKARKASKTGKKSVAPPAKMRWIHVDPIHELVNQPETVEAILFAEREGIPPDKWSSKRKVPIAYALAAEHVEVAHDDLRARLTDVTPRYASSWVETLKARGVLRGKQSKSSDEERVDLWWSEALKSVDPTNSHVKPDDNTVKASPMGTNLSSKGKNKMDAIVLDDDDDDDNNTNKKPAAKVTEVTPTRTASHNPLHEIDHLEKEEFSASVRDEPIPTSKTAFKSHPIYVIPSLFNANEVLVPDAKSRICGFFKGECVYRRTDVRVLLPAKKWLYKGHKVKEEELGRPTKRIKARKKPLPKGFKALKSYGVGQANDGSEEHRENQLEMASQPLEDGMEDVYAPWQTIPWSPPPVGPDEAIPVNEYRNIELELLNPGLVHVEEERIAVVAKQLGIPYAPCLLGFEGHGGNRTPTIRGIVVHQHNEELLREAHVEMASQFLEESHEKHQYEVYKRWKRLLVGVLTKDRLERQYGSDVDT